MAPGILPTSITLSQRPKSDLCRMRALIDRYIKRSTRYPTPCWTIDVTCFQGRWASHECRVRCDDRRGVDARAMASALRQHRNTASTFRVPQRVLGGTLGSARGRWCILLRELQKFGSCFSTSFASPVNLIGWQDPMIDLETCSYISAAMDIGFFQPTSLRVTCFDTCSCDLADFLDVLPAIALTPIRRRAARRATLWHTAARTGTGR
jgi:hypothetical protein